MKKFIVIYHTPIEAMNQMAETTPEEQKKGMDAWMVWAKKCGSQLVDLGAPLTNGQKISPDGTSQHSDKNVAGYSILEAENLDEVKSLLQGHPHLSWNADCSIEVHETMQLPGM